MSLTRGFRLREEKIINLKLVLDFFSRFSIICKLQLGISTIRKILNQFGWKFIKWRDTRLMNVFVLLEFPGQFVIGFSHEESISIKKQRFFFGMRCWTNYRTNRIENTKCWKFLSSKWAHLLFTFSGMFEIGIKVAQNNGFEGLFWGQFS